MAKNNAQVDVEENAEVAEAPGLNIDAGIILGTTIVLLVAIVCMALALKNHYQAGMLA